MQVRKFEAPTMAEALKIVKQEMGPEAIILSTKNHRKGFGLLSKASVEVTAAVADKDLVKKQITERVVPETTKNAIRDMSASRQANVYNDFSGHYIDKAEKMRRAREQDGKQKNRYIDILDDDDAGATLSTRDQEVGQPAAYGRNARITAPAAAPVSQSADMGGATSENLAAAAAHHEAMRDRLTQEMNAINASPAGGELDGLREDVKRLKMMMEELKTEQAAATDTKAVEHGSEELNAEFQSLLRNGLDRKYAAALIKQAAFSLPREAISDSERILEATANEMIENLRVENVLAFTPGSEQRIIAIVGPTGVGKTTTLAKLASQAILGRSMRVGLINLDSYRIGGADQLATYAKILNVPFRNATNEVELERALAEFRPLDMVLIDTTGRSQKDADGLTAVKNMLASVKGIKTMLLMSATTRDQELYDILGRFRVFSPAYLAFSKLDESSVHGCIYNVAVKTGIPLACFTVGQRVPEDIEPATKERVVDLILDL